MTLRPALACHLLGLAALRCASLLVPARQRAEWWREWRSELWHVRQVCTPERGVSWSAEREVAVFCAGAFEDARCLRLYAWSRRPPQARAMGSAAHCLLLLAGTTALSYGVALLLPGLSALIHTPRYRDVGALMLIQDARRSDDSAPTISAAQFRTWQRRRQELFDGFAFYHLAEWPASSAHRKPPMDQIAYATSNLFDLLGLSIRFAPESADAHDPRPKLILSDEVWKSDFDRDPHIAGRVVRLGTRDVMVAGVAPEGAWRLPGRAGAWVLLNPDAPESLNGLGYLVAHLKSPAANAQWGDSWPMAAPTPDGPLADFFCSSLKQRMQRPWNIFLFAVMLACLALPATTSLPLGEYRVSSHRLSWTKRFRRWSFLGCKIALLWPIVYFVSLDLAHLRSTIDPTASEYIQLVTAFSLCLFGLRWTLRDQRQRCPVCLEKLAHPARVGQPSRSFLDWNGTELICVVGHGLLHVPEMPTSWFSTQRWLYLDPSWEVLFANPKLASSGYL